MLPTVVLWECKPHQEEAVRWCLAREESANRGGILADDMGLGKTYELMGLMVVRQVLTTLIVVPPAFVGAMAPMLDKIRYRNAWFARISRTREQRWSLSPMFP